MVDVHEPKVRSYNMSQIKGKDTKPEIMVRKYLHSKGFRYRLQDKKLPGKPDIVLKKYKTVIFVHGCFWHGHENCRYFVIPGTRTQWWIDKIARNKLKDKENAILLDNSGWRTITVWECGLRPTNREETFKFLIQRLSEFH
jgi:DNA mismatch endonuclease, patch repair protein